MAEDFTFRDVRRRKIECTCKPLEEYRDAWLPGGKLKVSSFSAQAFSFHKILEDPKYAHITYEKQILYIGKLK